MHAPPDAPPPRPAPAGSRDDAAIAPPDSVALVVNDDPSQLRLLTAALEKAGIEAHAYLGVEDALASLNQATVDLIVTDLHMPGIDGWQFCQMLRSPQYPRFHHIPILVVSATFSGAEAEQLSFDLGADAFLAAPFPPSVLQEYAVALLNGQRPRPAARALLALPDGEDVERLRACFAARGYEVDHVRSGQAALHTWHVHHSEIAVVADPLPDLSAERVIEQIKRPGSRTVAFAVTAGDDPADALRLARRGADACLPSPVDAARVLDLCDKVQRQRSLMRIEELLEERSRALRDSEARWRSLFEAIPEIVVVHDDDGTIRHVNRMGAEQLGWPADELVGRTLREFERARPADALADPEPAPGEARSFETLYVTRTGREIEVEVNQRRIYFEGRPAVLSVARDVTVRQELARERQNFLAMLTHDIKNPLAVVLGFTGLLAEVGELNDEQRDLVGRMEANANTVLALVANYLNLTQIESGNLHLVKKPVSIPDVLESVVVQYRGQAERQRIALTLECAEGLRPIEGDALALERVFTNLLHNALKFTPDSGRIAITARSEDDEVVVGVRDTGAGIEAGDLANIFKPFERGMTRQPREGVGLGLFIAHSLVQAHRGRINVASTPGEGTCFTVRLPVA